VNEAFRIWSSVFQHSGQSETMLFCSPITSEQIPASRNTIGRKKQRKESEAPDLPSALDINLKSDLWDYSNYNFFCQKKAIHGMSM